MSIGNIGDATGLRYSWEQVSGPKVRIDYANSEIASFEAPNLLSGQDKLTLKFVLLITDNSESSNKK